MRAARKSKRRLPTVPLAFLERLDGPDERPDVVALFANLKASLPALRRLVADTDGEDEVYRFYHQSFKVFGLQGMTVRIVRALEALAPGRPLDEWFSRIVRDGTGKRFKQSDNERWPEVTRPIVEAHFHARHMLTLIVRCGDELEAPPSLLPSGWATILCLYGLR